MSSPRDPWADPATPTQPGAPYAGPPATAPPPAWPAPYGAPPYGGTPSGGWPPPYPGWGWPAGPPGPWGPRRPSRPGQVVGAAVLAFVQSALVLFGSLYVYFFASIAGLAAEEGGSPFFGATPGDLAREGQALALVQLASAVVLITGGILVLNRSTRAAWVTLLAAFGAQLVLSFYWAVRLTDLADAVPGGGAAGILLGMAIFYAVLPLTGLGLLLAGPARRWFADSRG